jgi:hypothetical protein
MCIHSQNHEIIQDENSKKGLVPVQRGTILSTSKSSSLGAEQDKIHGIQ